MNGYFILMIIYLFIIPQGFAIGSLFKGISEGNQGGIIIVDIVAKSTLICMDREDACNDASGFLKFYYDILDDRLRLEGSQDFPDPESVTAVTDGLFFIDIRNREIWKKKEKTKIEDLSRIEKKRSRK